MYSYAEQRNAVFTERGQRLFLEIRDNTHRLLKLAGAARMQEIMADSTGCSWDMLACVDRLVELEEIRELTKDDVCGQHRVFVSGRNAPEVDP
jgi:hypothetical protein